MSSVARSENIYQWGFFLGIFYALLGFVIPFVGVPIGIYGLLHRGIRWDGFLVLFASFAGVYYMPQILLILFFAGGAMH